MIYRKDRDAAYEGGGGGGGGGQLPLLFSVISKNCFPDERDRAANLQRIRSLKECENGFQKCKECCCDNWRLLLSVSLHTHLGYGLGGGWGRSVIKNDKGWALGDLQPMATHFDDVFTVS